MYNMLLSIRKYKKAECITFKSTKGKYGGLSNMAPGYPVYIHGVYIRTVEALYQALRFPNNPQIQRQIINYSSPISAKAFARTQIDKTRNDWDKQRFKIMKFCLELKYFYNKKQFSETLLSTLSYPIVEYTDKDKVWGATDEGDYYSGTNALGRLLMELRDNVVKDRFELTLPQIDGFVFLEKEINYDSISFSSNNLI